jgi:pyridinium-3,5-biscarboxylic acid mononucleotide sulfurtransferase
MIDTPYKKYELLKSILKSYGNMVLAYSGGKDSTLLLYTAMEVLGPEHVVAVTAVSPIRRDEEKKLASELGKRLGTRHEVVLTMEYKNEEFINNPDKRCFICKTELFDQLRRFADQVGFKNLVDGTNLDDSRENRPVFEIARKYGIKWPLAEAEIGTYGVKLLLEVVGLKDFVRPHYSCSAWEIDLRNIAAKDNIQE